MDFTQLHLRGLGKPRLLPSYPAAHYDKANMPKNVSHLWGKALDGSVEI